MIYPENFEQKIGFDKIRNRLKTYCLSPLGIRKADEMAFSGNYHFISKQLNLTGELKIICQTEDEFPSSHYFDLTPVLNHLKVEGTFPEIEELFNMQRSLETIKAIYTFFKTHGEDKYPSLWETARNLHLYPFVNEKINAILTTQGKIKDSASAQLSSIRRDIRNKESEVSRYMQRIMKQAQSEGWANESDTLAIREGRLVVPVNSLHKRKIKGFIHDESATGKTSFIEPAEVVELNNDLKELEYAERREIVKILVSFADEIRPYIEDLLFTYDFLGEIDFLRAKALFGIEINGVQPPFNNSQTLEWYNTIHPLLYLHFKDEQKKVVPLNIRLNSQNRILVISGPNAGGKSVCLQTVGLIQYMLQCGLLVPVKETSETGVFNNIFLDIGDEQSIDNDLSTYSSHLLNMKYFVRNADNKSLILIDEFGAGTEPMLGGAIAESILEELNKFEAFGIITTHYTSLKHFASQTKGIINGAMLFDTQHLQPLFKLEIGEPGSSFAFEIARKIGLSEAILQSATQKVGIEHIDYDRNLKNIIRDKHYWQQKRDHIKDSGKRLDEVLERYSAELEELKQLRKETLQKAKTEAQQILEGVNKQIENTIKEIKESQADKEKTRQARKKIDELKEKVNISDSIEDERIARKIEQIQSRDKRKMNKQPHQNNDQNIQEVTAKTDPKIKAGDKVRLFGQDAVGEVLDVTNKSILVAFGSMITSLHENKLEKISNNEYRRLHKQMPQSLKKNTFDVSEKKLNFKPQIDVRGMRADEALQRVAEYIEESIMVDISEVKILHGKGNGVLRELIRNYLKSVDFNLKFEDEHIEFGGTGITVVKFKIFP
jgi:DNA mismatch repair protein MutS2